MKPVDWNDLDAVWNDPVAVDARIWGEIYGPRDEFECWLLTHPWEWDELVAKLPLISRPPSAAEIERNVIERFRDGDLKPMAKLVRAREHLSAEVRNLVADHLDGKLKRPRGRPPKKIKDRESPLTEAARDFPALKYWLGIHFPNRRRGEIHDRAVEMAARQWDVAEDSLRNLLNRSKGDRRRLPAQ
jgi:hypothetical protein